MKTQIKTLLFCTALAVFTSCNANSKNQRLAIKEAKTEHLEPNKQYIKVWTAY